MGQTVIGVLYGVEVPAGLIVRYYDAEEEDPNSDDDTRELGLADRWEGNPLSESHPAFHARRDEAGAYLLGFWVVAENGHIDGAGELVATPVSELIKLSDYYRARASWDTFAWWATAEGVQLPEPSLWIAPREVA